MRNVILYPFNITIIHKLTIYIILIILNMILLEEYYYEEENFWNISINNVFNIVDSSRWSNYRRECY